MIFLMMLCVVCNTAIYADDTILYANIMKLLICGNMSACFLE